MKDPPVDNESSSYVDMSSAEVPAALTPEEVVRLKQLLASNNWDSDHGSLDSEYPEFMESTHAWAVFADHPEKRATTMDRVVGTLIIAFQLFTYWVFAAEAIEDYQVNQVVVRTSHNNCLSSSEQPQDSFTCEANFTNNFDAFIAFFMLGVFLTGDFLKAARVIHSVPFGTTTFFACLAGVEIVAAYLSACIAVSYNLHIGEVTDAVAVGVGLLFIRELSSRAYAGIRYGKAKQYKSFFGVLAALIAIGMVMDPLCERLFAVQV